MNYTSTQALQHRVIMAAREYGISTTLFRNTVSKKLRVHVTDMECLALLLFKGIATPTELSSYTGLSSGATTAMLDRLEKAKLLHRKPNPNDRRGTHVEVDARSILLVGPMFAETRDAQDQLVASYSPQELEIIALFFERFTAIWEEGRKKLVAR